MEMKNLKLIPLVFATLTLAACDSNKDNDEVKPEEAFASASKAAKKTSESDHAQIKTKEDGTLFGQGGVEIKNEDSTWNYFDLKISQLPIDFRYSGYSNKDASSLNASLLSQGDENSAGATIKLNTDYDIGSASTFVPASISDLSFATYLEQGTLYVDSSDSDLALYRVAISSLISSLTGNTYSLPQKGKISLSEDGLTGFNNLINDINVDISSLEKLYADVPSVFGFKNNEIKIETNDKNEFKSYLKAVYNRVEEEMTEEEKSSAASIEEEFFNHYDVYLDNSTFNKFSTSIYFDENGLTGVESSLSISDFDHDGIVASLPEEQVILHGNLSYSADFAFAYDESVLPLSPLDKDKYQEIEIPDIDINGEITASN